VSQHLVFISPYCPTTTSELKQRFSELQSADITMYFLLAQIQGVDLSPSTTEEISEHTDLGDFALLCTHLGFTAYNRC
jgi:hypothetical protein